METVERPSTLSFHLTQEHDLLLIRDMGRKQHELSKASSVVLSQIQLHF